jgi:hypothetical protein
VTELIDEPATFLPSHPVAVAPASAATCACGHEAARHDTTALRYCRATEFNELQRDCICDIANAQPMSRR